MPLDPETLTPRQRKVYALMQTGIGEAEIARRLGMGRGNVHSACGQIRYKESGGWSEGGAKARLEELNKADRCPRCRLLLPCNNCVRLEPEARRGE